MSDTSQALRDTENALRDVIFAILVKQFPSDWETHLGVSADRITRWRERNEVERTRQRGAPIEERLLYYSDFYDLWEILKKNWELFAPVLGERKIIEVWLSELERLRDPNAHSRDLLPFQKNLALGIAGDIRGRIVRYRSKMETADDYFPKIESVRDSVGHSWTPVSSSGGRPTIREGDLIEFVVTATDPKGDMLEYGYKWHPIQGEMWSPSNAFTLKVEPTDIGKMKELHIRIRSPRTPRAHLTYDDFVMFHYDVLPKR